MPSRPADSSLRTRAITAAALIPVVALVIWLGGWFVVAAIVGVGLLAWRELAALFRTTQHPPFFLMGAALVAILIVEPVLLPGAGWQTAIPLALLASLIWALFQPHSQPATDWAITLAGALYLGLCLGHFALLRALPHGLEWLAVAILATWINDTGAYLVGRTWGRRKLWPRLSPKKTWEGLFGGLALTALLMAWPLSNWLPVALPTAVALGLLIGVVATLGDLAESLFKRQAGVKDSGHLIRGHGGMLDRIDSLLFVVPTVYYVALWV